MRRLLRASVSLALLCAACDSEKPPVETPVVDACTGLPPLALTVSPERVRVSDPVALEASGGSGHYRFRVEPGGSSGEVRGERFIAGPTPSTDSVVVEDVRCPGEARARVAVVAAFGVAPVRATVRPGTSFQVELTGLLGDPVFLLEGSSAGSTVTSSGQYTAGAGEGLDLVRVRDGRTGDEALLRFEVRADAGLRGAPSLLALPAGSSVPLVTEGGSDRVSWSKVIGPGTVEGALFTAEPWASGTAVLEATDAFTGDKTRVSVRVLEELTRETLAHGRLWDEAQVVTADFDGDGVPDVAVGQRDSDLARPVGGAVFIFKGSLEGLPPEPTWVITGESDTARLGDVMVAGDLDGDGRAELAVSSPGADVTIGDSGAVYLYRFGANGPEPMRSPLTGLGRGSFGSGLALSDMDGDGDLDLVVGSPLGDLAPTRQLTRRGVVDIFLLTPGEPIPELPAVRLGGSDLGQSGALEDRANTELGRALVVADLNGDGLEDLAALGKSSLWREDGSSAGVVQPAVSVFFARAEGARYRATPDVYVLPEDPSDGNEGRWKLGAVPGEGGRPPLLMVLLDRVNSPDLSGSGGLGSMTDAGGALLFDVSEYASTGEPLTTPVQVKFEEAWARLYGDSAYIQAGRSWAVADVDGVPGLELLLGAPYSYSSVDGSSLRYGGEVLVYSLAELSRGAVRNVPEFSLGGTQRSDAFGTGIAAWPLPGSQGLVVFASRASAEGREYTGKVDAFVKAGSSLTEWTRTSVAVPARPSSERFGEAVAVARGPTGVVALVGAPGWSGPGRYNDGNDLSVGRAWSFGAAGSEAVLVGEGASSPYSSGRAVGTDVDFTDFNGDGRPDLVMGAPNLIQPGASTRGSEITPVYALERPECIPASSLTAGGVLVSLGQADGSFTPALRLWAPGDIEGCTETGSACQRRSVGRGVVGGFDFNGDGKQDIGALRNNGFEVFLGRAPDDGSLTKLSMGCDPIYTAPYTAQQTSAPTALGDLDGDGCDEVAWRYSSSSKAGVVVLFGYDAGGARCGKRTQPAWVRLVGDPEVGTNYLGLGVAMARVGKLLGPAGPDLLAVSASSVPVDGVTQPVVLLYETAALVARRPPSGEALVAALGDELEPRVLVHRSRAVGFGTSLAGGVDVTGDGVPDLVVGAPGASVASDAGGAVFVYAGGADVAGALSPRLTLVGDASEQSAFGQELAVVPGSGGTPPTLVIGAPLSYRTGTQNGTAFRVPLGF